ncbi:hypothetical protein ACOME3_006464 [Neoechinorhynchus agilis]
MSSSDSDGHPCSSQSAMTSETSSDVQCCQLGMFTDAEHLFSGIRKAGPVYCHMMRDGQWMCEDLDALVDRIRQAPKSADPDNTITMKILSLNPSRVHLTFVRLYTNRNITKLRERGLFLEILPTESQQIVDQLTRTPQSVYCGFDPTSPSLHIGHLLCLINLIHCQRAGHQPIVVIGGATAILGDPSGHDKERVPLDDTRVVENSMAIQHTVKSVFDNHQKYFWKQQDHLAPVYILNNLQWYERMNVINFLSKYGKDFRLGDLLSRKTVRDRMESSSSGGLSVTEFCYQIFQAYDWFHLSQKYGCRFQIGGNDQQGNIRTGIEFLKRHLDLNVYGLSCPLLVDNRGFKLGKSSPLRQRFWLNKTMSSPFDIYQHFRNVSDSQVEQYLKLFTFIPDIEISNIMREHIRNPERYKAQVILAKNVVHLVHGDEGLEDALLCTEALFSQKTEALAKLNMVQLERLFLNIPSINLAYEPGLTLKRMIVQTRHCETEIDAENLIQKGAVYLNHVRITNPDVVILNDEHVLPSKCSVLMIGKKAYFLIRWQNT